MIVCLFGDGRFFVRVYLFFESSELFSKPFH